MQSHKYQDEHQQNHHFNHGKHRYYNQDRNQRYRKSSDANQFTQYDSLDNNYRTQHQAQANPNFTRHDDNGTSYLDHRHQHRPHGRPYRDHHHKHNPSQQAIADDSADKLGYNPSGRSQTKSSRPTSTRQHLPQDQRVQTTNDTTSSSHNDTQRLDTDLTAQPRSQVDNHNNRQNPIASHHTPGKGKPDPNYKSDKLQRSNEPKRNDRFTSRNNAFARHRGKGTGQSSYKQANTGSSNETHLTTNHNNKSHFINKNPIMGVDESIQMNHQNQQSQLSNNATGHSKNSTSAKANWRNSNNNDKVNNSKAFKGSVRYFKVT